MDTTKYPDEVILNNPRKARDWIKKLGFYDIPGESVKLFWRVGQEGINDEDGEKVLGMIDGWRIRRTGKLQWEITLFKGGNTLDVLLHELAHINAREDKDHGPDFEKAWDDLESEAFFLLNPHLADEPEPEPYQYTPPPADIPQIEWWKVFETAN